MRDKILNVFFMFAMTGMCLTAIVGRTYGQTCGVPGKPPCATTTKKPIPKKPLPKRGPVAGAKSKPRPKPVPKTVEGDVLNGKATSLPKPAYPPAAKAVGASGAVSVQVLIDENGSVVSASAVSGHPLLRAAAEEAARGAKFSPTLLAGQPVKVSGVITYNFVP